MQVRVPAASALGRACSLTVSLWTGIYRDLDTNKDGGLGRDELKKASLP